MWWVTTAVRARHSLRRALGFLDAAFDALAGQVVIVDESGRVMSGNAAWRRGEHGLVVGDDLLAFFGRLGTPGAAQARALLGDVLAGDRDAATLADVAPWGGARHFDLAMRRFRHAGRVCVVLESIDVSEHVEAERLARRREAQLADARRLEAVARLAGGVAHDFNNMLTVIRTTTALLRMKATDSRTLADLAEIDQAASRATELTRQLLAFGRRHVARPRRIDLAAVVAGLTGLVSRLVGDEVQVRFSRPPAPVEVVADPGDIERVILNLAANAREAMPGGGRLELGVETVEIGAADAQVPLPAGTYARLIVHDDGNGMDDEVRLRCLDPFFTTKEGGRGAGLGLTTVHGVVAQLGGHVAVASAPGAGTRVSVYVPRAAAPARAAGDEGSPAGEVGARGLGTVLVVDDEPSVRRGIARVLRDQGYAVVETSSPAEALELYRADPGRFDLVLSDVVMPAMTGPELVERMREGGRAPRVLFVSGHAGGEHTWRLRDDDVLLVKPFSPDELSGRVRELMGPRVGPR